MQSTLNLKIKFRESFRPFAPVVLREAVHDWFEMSPGEESPYMLFVAHVRGARRTADRTQTVGQRLGERRSRIPAVTHVDGSARVQTVDARRSPLLHRLLEAFRARTGCPVMINTSFNVRDEPIVCSPLDAYRCFWATGMDALVMGRTVLRKDRQPAEFRSNRSHRSPVAPKTKSGWLHIDRRPTPRKLRQFAGVACLVLPLVAAVWAPGRTVWLIASLATGFLAVLVSWLRPRWLSRVYIALSVATAPIGMVVAELMLFLSFFGVLTAMGLTRRLRGRHSLEVDQDKLRESYWHDVRDSRQGEDSYFRQY
jgi:hypothetical protein